MFFCFVKHKSNRNKTVTRTLMTKVLSVHDEKLFFVSKRRKISLELCRMLAQIALILLLLKQKLLCCHLVFVSTELNEKKCKQLD